MIYRSSIYPSVDQSVSLHDSSVDISSVPDNGTVFATAHAWTEVFIGGMIGNNGWIPVETACTVDEIEIDIQQNFGVEDAFHLRLFIDDGSNQSLTHYVSNIQYTTYNGHIQPPESFVEIRDYEELETKKLIVSTDNLRRYER